MMTITTQAMTTLAQQDPGAVGAVGGVALMGLMCAFALFGLALLGFWIWMLVDCATKEFPGNNKIVWILVIVLTGWIGALVYYFVGRPKGTKAGQAG